MEIEWTLAFANLILHANNLKMVRRFDDLISVHKTLGGLADGRRTHHIRHKLCRRRGLRTEGDGIFSLSLVGC